METPDLMSIHEYGKYRNLIQRKAGLVHQTLKYTDIPLELQNSIAATQRQIDIVELKMIDTYVYLSTVVHKA